MRKFSSYGPVDTDLHYYVPRTVLVEQICQQVCGENPDKGGHYITVWAPRQSGKTWLLQQVAQQLHDADQFEVAILTMQSAKSAEKPENALQVLVTGLRAWFERPDLPAITTWQELPTLFTAPYFKKPLILILDEFDALAPAFINAFANEFRSIHTQRQNEHHKLSHEKSYLLHGLALIGVRSVLGVENVSGSPFNVQRSIHVPNLTHAEVEAMLRWYETESGQPVEQAVIDRLYAETRGQPGLVGWFGELLTETYNRHNTGIIVQDFEVTLSASLNLLPNNNILNIISKARQEPYVQTLFKLYETDQKFRFSYDDPHLNFLYLNGVIDQTTDDQINYYVRFASPFVQKRLFNYFSRQFFGHLGTLYDPFADLADTITPTTLAIPQLLRRYESYLQQHRARLLKDAPRRESDNRIMEAIFHFNLYTWLVQFFADFNGRVTPEFPTGNGKIDLLITYAGQLYGLEVKSFVNRTKYQEALGQAARYAQQLQQAAIWLAFFVETVSDENRRHVETPYTDAATGVQVYPILVMTGA
ncbi:MAG: hypothetical protein ACOYNY_30240 [Caldilineaceae bacterium]